MSSEVQSQIVEAVIEALKNNPELLKPTAQNLSKASDTVTAFLNTALTPIELLNFIVKEHKEKFIASYHDKLNKIPEDQRIEPRIEIIGPIIENLKYKITEKTLRETYAKLLASASNSSYSNEPLLSYNFVLNQLSPKEIEVLIYLFNKQHIPIVRLILPKENFTYSPLIDNVIDNHFNELDDEALITITCNLIRLGLIKVSYTEEAITPNAYEYVENLSIYKSLKDELKKIHKIEPKLEFRKGVLDITSFGNSFCGIIFEQNNSTI